MIKAAIFDLDGTLSYTLDSIAISGNEALMEIGMQPYETERYKYFCGDGAAELVKRILYNNGDTQYEHFDELRAIYRRTFAKYADYNIRVYDGVPELLSALKSRGIKLAVLTNKPHPQAIEVVEKLYGKGTFDYIQGNTKEIPRKPSPQGALMLCELMEVEPAECLYIGDTATDMQTGNSAGMNTVGVLWGYRTREELAENNAGVIIEKPGEVMNIINSQLWDEDELLAKIVETVHECGKIILEAERSDEMIASKEGHANFVTTYDKNVQAELEKRLTAIIPNSAFAGEEGDGFCVPDKGIVFIVDPIDGTTNFICDLHASCISVGVLKDGMQWIGVVYNPYLNETYTAIKGKGAFLNGKKIAVTKRALKDSLSIFGTSPYNTEYAEKSFELAYKLFRQSADIRRGGSAAIDLCQVAAGRANIYFEMVLSPWDFAAGSLIVTEAGGIITTMNNEGLDFTKKCSAVARCAGMEEIVNDLFFGK